MRIVAVDLAAGELRVVWGERGIGAARVTAVERVSLDGDREGLHAALATLARARPAAVLTALPLGLATHRILTLPFRDGRRLARTAPLELLGHLPIDPDDLTTVTRPLGPRGAGTDVLAVAVRRAALDAYLAVLAEGGLPATRVELAPLPALALLPHGLADAALVVADGAASTAVVRRDGRVAGLRALGADAGDPRDLAAEVVWTLRALGFSGPTLCTGPDAHGLHAALSESLDGPVDVLVPPSVPGTAEDLTACAVPLGLVLGDGRRGAAGVTLGGGDDLSGRWKRSAALAAAALLLGLVDVGLVRSALVRREDVISRAAVELAAAALPGTPVHAARAQLEEAVAARRRLRPAGDVPVLEVLRELSDRVPDTLRLDVDELVIEPDVIRLHGRAESFDAVDGLRAALAASPMVREVLADETRTTVDGKGVEFRLHAERRTAVGAPS